jgi:hypothetical protein
MTSLSFSLFSGRIFYPRLIKSTVNFAAPLFQLYKDCTDDKSIRQLLYLLLRTSELKPFYHYETVGLYPYTKDNNNFISVLTSMFSFSHLSKQMLDQLFNKLLIECKHSMQHSNKTAMNNNNNDVNSATYYSYNSFYHNFYQLCLISILNEDKLEILKTQYPPYSLMVNPISKTFENVRYIPPYMLTERLLPIEIYLLALFTFRNSAIKMIRQSFLSLYLELVRTRVTQLYDLTLIYILNKIIGFCNQPSSLGFEFRIAMADFVGVKQIIQFLLDCAQPSHINEDDYDHIPHHVKWHVPNENILRLFLNLLILIAPIKNGKMNLPNNTPIRATLSNSVPCLHQPSVNIFEEGLQFLQIEIERRSNFYSFSTISLATTAIDMLFSIYFNKRKIEPLQPIHQQH